MATESELQTTCIQDSHAIWCNISRSPILMVSAIFGGKVWSNSKRLVASLSPSSQWYATCNADSSLNSVDCKSHAGC
jgi:hypothetical protein